MADDFDDRRVTWVLDDLALARLKVVLQAADEITFDIEATGLNEHRPNAKVALISFTLPNWDTWVVPLYHPDSPFLGSWRKVLRELAQILRTKYLIAHNAKYDCRWIFKHTGVDLSHAQGWDSALGAHLLDENRSRKLKEVAPPLFGIERWDDFDLTKEGAVLTVNLFDLGYYAARDTYWTQRLAHYQRARMFLLDGGESPMDDDEVEDARLGRLMTWCVMPTSRSLTAIEQRGIGIDLDWVEEQIARDKAIEAENYRWLVALVGDEGKENASFAPTATYFENWTKRCVEAGYLKVAGMTKTGRPTWSKAVLVRQARAGSQAAAHLLVYRAATKRLEFLRTWKASLAADGFIHASYNAGSTVTGRLSSDSPNMQQVTKALRPAFVPRPGYVIADFDYSQIELRIAAHIAGCEPMKRAFEQGWDLHRMIAATITGKPGEQVTDDERQKGKAANFGFLFGQSAYGFKFYAEDAYGVSMDDQQAAQAYEAFFETWTGMAAWHQRTVDRAYKTGQVVSPIGRVRRLPLLFSSSEKAQAHAEKTAINSPVQGFASDMMQIAAAWIEGALPGYEGVEGARIVATVHDSIVVELREDDWQRIGKQVMERMLSVPEIVRKMDCDFSVPLAVDMKVGTRWGLADVSEVA